MQKNLKIMMLQQYYYNNEFENGKDFKVIFSQNVIL